mmetsp:Transcript_39565/g.77321  ORF Transcript_39565/g.77321 Transcript_39565/m.77321 type:complete len:229 (+) Transcript_39565:279-965(+)
MRPQAPAAGRTVDPRPARDGPRHLRRPARAHPRSRVGKTGRLGRGGRRAVGHPAGPQPRLRVDAPARPQPGLRLARVESGVRSGRGGPVGDARGAPGGGAVGLPAPLRVPPVAARRHGRVRAGEGGAAGLGHAAVRVRVAPRRRGICRLRHSPVGGGGIFDGVAVRRHRQFFHHVRSARSCRCDFPTGRSPDLGHRCGPVSFFDQRQERLQTQEVAPNKCEESCDDVA